MTLTLLAVLSCVLAAVPAYMFLRNWPYYSVPPLSNAIEVAGVSVLIPARNEERAIGSAVAAALNCQNMTIEVMVLDDGSEDHTAEIVSSMGAHDPRVGLVAGRPLPPGWSGKQHACRELARHAKYDLLLFIDADVRLEPEGIARLLAFQKLSGADLVSGVPRQITGTFAERLVIPLIHFVLLGYLPFWLMRLVKHPALGAGCGQLFLTTRAAYEQIDGHAAIRNSFHDGVQLPRAYRRAGLRTDLCDATPIASCRMYHSAGQLWIGLAKNAGEGIGSLGGIIPWTILLAGGHILPFVLLACYKWLAVHQRWPVVIACCLAWMPRCLSVLRFQQSWLGALFHPIGVGVLLTIQWYALARRTAGKPIGWKGRTQPVAGAPG